jgi:hypothetical protein
MKNKIKAFLTSLSGNKFLRKYSDFIRNWHAGYVMGDGTKKAIALGRIVGVYRGMFFWRYAPRKYAGGAFLSLIGLPVLRYYFYNLRYLMRSPRGAMATEIKTRGVVVKRRGLSQESVVRLLDFYANNCVNCANHFNDFSKLVILNSKGVTRKEPAYLELAEHLLKDCGMDLLGSDVTGVKLTIAPFVSILHYKSYPDQQGQSDGQDMPHADVFYPSLKLFVYLNDVNESNGAFRYLQYSNRFSLKGAINAYKDSFRHYFQVGKRSLYPTNASIVMTGDGVEWLSVSGRPGDCVLFNVQGINRRGDFAKDQYRERLDLLVDFLQAEVPIQRFAANV